MKAATSEIIPVSQASKWMEALALCGGYDVYHLPQYHQLAEQMGEGKAHLFAFGREGAFAALPFLLRPVAEVKGLEESQANDITSVYGYPGIVTSMREGAVDADAFRRDFQAALRHQLAQWSIVAFFSRTNPLLPTTWMLKGMADILPLSKTVAIDLSRPDEEQLADMGKTHKYQIRKARKAGLTVEEDESFCRLDEFIKIYNETMQRNGASAYYFFPKDYYLQLKSLLGKCLRLYFARHDGQAVSASMFFMINGIIQYHLGGTPAEFFAMNGAKLIFDEVRQMGAHEGWRWLHLGGGVGSSEDSLFRFKAGFSKIHLPFEVVRMIVQPDAYVELTGKRREWARQTGQVLEESQFFPEYRKRGVDYPRVESASNL